MKKLRPIQDSSQTSPAASVALSARCTRATQWSFRLGVTTLLTALLFACHGFARADSQALRQDDPLVIPRLSQPPKLEDFLEMKPGPAWEGRMAKLQGFIQRLPSDGQPSSQKTEVYLGYDDRNFYCVFVAFDSEPGKIRAHKVPRDYVTGDDKLDLFLDTYHDRRRAYVFTVNPLGYQMDGLWTEGPRNQFDNSFDTVWQSRGQLTDRGFVVWLAVPFKSLRFPAVDVQTWGIVLVRWIPRNNESATWPRVSTRIEGRLSQEATMTGLRGLSPGSRGMLIPYGYSRSYRALDQGDPDNPVYERKAVDPRIGLTGKLVLKDTFALDMTVNPDFSQVESDQPQVTVNRRFEVYYPEKRPFFLENPSYFETPINLLFTRRIADPQFGVRLTGKRGPYAIGALFADDRSPGQIVPPGDPLEGKRAYFSVVRLSRDIFRQSTVGMIYTDREFAGTHNRVGGVDTRLKLRKNWWASLQAVSSATTFTDGTRMAGPAYKAQLRRDSRQLYYSADYYDFSPGFDTETGFISDDRVERPVYVGRSILRPPLRTDMRSFGQIATYSFRPEGKFLISWGPTVFVNPVWDHRGNRLDMFTDHTLGWEFTGQTAFELYYTGDQEMLRPRDFVGLPGNRTYSHHRQGLYFETAFLDQFGFRGDYSRGSQINIVPPQGQLPELADLTLGSVSVLLRPEGHLRIENTYLFERLGDRATGASIFNNHIIRSKWGWQFTKEFSVRTILQFNTVLASPGLTSLETTKNFNADFLFTYLVNPFTALYIGYNGNLDNLDLIPYTTGNQIVRTRGLAENGHQFFVKLSYLLRF